MKSLLISRIFLCTLLLTLIDCLLATGESPADTKAAPASPKPDLRPRQKPPVIIIKVDDLRQVNGRVPGAWLRLVDFLKSRKIKASIGIICQTLQDATPQYAQWIKDQQASGQIEFWFHGWDHAVHTV